MHTWSPTSWLQYSYQYVADYPNPAHLLRVLSHLSLRPPLIKIEEIKKLKNLIALAGRSEAFIMQGGDCAELFADCRTEVISSKVHLLAKMNSILFQKIQKPIIPIGRIAGQYAKPRTSGFETLNGIKLPSYRGDLINSAAFNAIARQPNPELLLKGYDCAAMTLSIIQDLLRTNVQLETLNLHGFFTSHEALHLYYEQALTRCSTDDGLWYNVSTHLPWIGMRTAKNQSAHIEFLRGVQNPIGIKIGTDVNHAELIEVIRTLNPQQEEGRILLITRMGASHIEDVLPPLIKAVNKSKAPVTWSCDPMHGNTEYTATGLKTRHFDNIAMELQRAITIHQKNGRSLGGIHLELTGEHVTECLGGTQELSIHNLSDAYHSAVDPRLNHEQSIEIAALLNYWTLDKKI